VHKLREKLRSKNLTEQLSHIAIAFPKTRRDTRYTDSLRAQCKWNYFRCVARSRRPIGQKRCSTGSRGLVVLK